MKSRLKMKQHNEKKVKSQREIVSNRVTNKKYRKKQRLAMITDEALK